MILKLKADKLGIVSSGLCLVHCLATPFLFLAKTCSATTCSHAPVWWQSIDYLFLIVSFVAIKQATKKVTKNWLPNVFWIAWSILLLAIVNETFEIVLVSELFIYIPAFVIIGLHFYNHKCCEYSERC
ncbi:MerC domain-containing protein [Corallibacter sp.]|uniref:MerC domain-containing protein n=1 Tax=Corallibacter sp. TaxID=2038084 RepID=UPI003AB46C7A